MALPDLTIAETGVHKHSTTSTVEEIGLQEIPGTETHLHNLHRTPATVKITSSDLPSNETGVYKHRTTSAVVESEFQHFLVPKHTCTTYTGQ